MWHVANFRFLLPTGNGPDEESHPTFRYRVFLSNNKMTWKKVVDKSENDCRGWQIVRFDPRPLGIQSSIRAYLNYLKRSGGTSVSESRSEGKIYRKSLYPPPPRNEKLPGF